MPLRRHVVLETDRNRVRFLGPVFLFIRFPDECLGHVLSLRCGRDGERTGFTSGEALKPVRSITQSVIQAGLAGGAEIGKLGGYGYINWTSSQPFLNRNFVSGWGCED